MKGQLKSSIKLGFFKKKIQYWIWSHMETEFSKAFLNENWMMDMDLKIELIKLGKNGIDIKT